MKFTEERLDRNKHFVIVGDFCCGADDPLDVFLSDNSFDYDEHKLGNTYLLFETNSNTLLAFYTIKANGIQIYDTETNEYNAIPVIEIARIAVHHEFQNSGIGKMLFYDYILPKIKDVSEKIAVSAIMVFVESHNETGINFYKSIGFKKPDENVQKYISETFNEKCDLYVVSLSNAENKII